jgi:uncharacterized protein YoxC
MHPLIPIGCTLALVGAAYVSIRKLIGVIMATKDEVIANLTALNSSLEQVRTETTALVAKVAELEEAIENSTDVPEEIATLVSEISAKVKAIDDLVPNVPDPEDPQA